MMRIAMLVNNLNVSGGYQKLVIRLTQELQRKGHEITIYAASADSAQCYPPALETLKVITPRAAFKSFFGRPVFSQYAAPYVNALKFRALGALIGSEVDAVFIHDELSLYALAGMEIPSGVPVIWMLNNELTDNLEFFSSRPCRRKAGGNWLIGKVKAALRYPADLQEWSLFRKGLAKVTAAAVYDEYNRQQVAQRLKIPVVNVYAGADTEIFSTLVAERRKQRQGAIHVLSVGVMFPHRRYEDLIEAVASVRKDGVDVRLTIVGRRDLCPDYSSPISKLPARLGCEKHVDFRDVVSEKELLGLYREADAFSFANDGKTWGISVFEAIAARLPVIVSDNIGAVDLLVHDKLAWVVPPRSPEALANAIKDIALNPDKVELTTLRASEMALPVVAWSAYAERMLALVHGNKDAVA